MSIRGEKISVQWDKINVTPAQGEVDFGTATREILNELCLNWEHFGLLPDLQRHIIAARQHLLQFHWRD